MANAEAQRRWQNRKKRQLQRQVMLEMAEEGLSEREAESKHHLLAGTVAKWFRDAEFRDEMMCVAEAANWGARMLIARGAKEAARRLVALTECDKEETRRKACLDIIRLLAVHGEEECDKNRAGDQRPEWLNDGMASRLLEMLAEERGKAEQRARVKNEK